MFRRFRNYQQIGGKKGLPYDAEVEYIESTRTQYIDTGVVGSNDLVISGKFRYLKIDSAYSNILGCRSATGSTSDDQISFTASSSSYVGWGRSESQILNFEVNKDYDFSFRRGLIVRNGVSATFTTGRFTPSGLTIYLFCRNQAGSVANLSMSRIYHVSISNSTSLLIDLIPVRFTNELGVSEGAMYDKVSGQLFRNAGAGAFVVGPDKKTTIPWIKFDGSSAIVLGGITSNIEVEITAKYNRAGNLFGSFSNSTYYALGPYKSSNLAATVWGSGRRANVPEYYADGSKRTYLVNGENGLSVDGGDFTPFSGSITNKSVIYFAIGARGRSATTVDNYTTATVYSCKIRNLDGTGLFDLTPVDIGGGVGGLYDSLSGRTFAGIGTGTIQYGEDDE